MLTKRYSFINDTAIAYAYVFKGNSENIHHSFARLDDKYSLVYNWPQHLKVYNSWTLEAMKKKSQERYGTDDIKVFTFMRDPLSHFLSGLVESYFKKLGVGSRPNMTDALITRMRHRRAGYHKARHLLDALIFGNDHMFLARELAQLSHFSVQSYSLLKWQPAAIGFLESFEEDWRWVNRELGLDVPYHPRSAHPTSQDPMSLKQSLLQVLSKQPRYLRAVCRLLMVDYICLQYSLPEVCSNMTTTTTTATTTAYITNDF
jgi:hypothetical protein